MKKLFLLILLFSFVNCFASELEAEFSFDQNINVLREGDVVTATLRVWPLENPNKEFFGSLLNKTLFDSFYLAEIVSMESSVNNADVFELKGRFIVASKVNADKLVLNYENNNIHVKYHEVLFRPLDEKNNDFYVLNQSDGSGIYISIIVVVVGLLVLALFYYNRDKLLSFFKKKKVESKEEFYKNKFLKASSRQDFEWIYANKEEWTKLIETITPAHLEFFNVLNLHQYKRSWSREEEKEVVESFDVIRGSFK